MLLRPAIEADLSAINAIYNHYVLHSTATYQEEPTTAEDSPRLVCRARPGVPHHRRRDRWRDPRVGLPFPVPPAIGLPVDR